MIHTLGEWLINFLTDPLHATLVNYLFITPALTLIIVNYLFYILEFLGFKYGRRTKIKCFFQVIPIVIALHLIAQPWL